MAMSPAAKTAVLITVGLFLAFTGLIMYIMFPRILKWQVEENLVLTPDAEPYEYWRVVPVPIYCKFYFFNITNHDDILSSNAKPMLQELGPYTFREEREKVNITWHDNGTVSYYQVKRWFFMPDMTTGSLDDEITTVNVPMVATANSGKIQNDEFYLQAIESMLDYAESTVFITRAVRNLLFEGYSEVILTTAQGMGLPVPYDKFGWFYPKNNSHDGVYTIFTGKNNVDNYGRVEKWNGQSLIRGREFPCAHIEGTAGDMWPPFRKTRHDKLDLFVADICSTLHLNYLSDVEVNDIDSYRYWLDETAFDNGMYNRNNSCFCAKSCKPKGGNCTKSCMPPGALDIQECQHGTPAVVSFPHFLYADSKYRSKVAGLKPDPELHRFIIDLEPQLGIPVNVEAKLQINVAIPKINNLTLFQFPNETIYYPIFWFSESASIDLETAEKLKFVTKMLPQYVTIGCFLSVIIGGILVILTAHFAIRRHRSKPSKQMVYTAVRVIHRK